jgi:hypothetical protein
MGTGLSYVALVLWVASAPGVFALLALRAKTSGRGAGAWAGCIVALGVLALMAFEYFSGGRRDAQGALIFVFGPAYAWVAGLAVACPIWLGTWLWRITQGGRGTRR